MLVHEPSLLLRSSNNAIDSFVQLRVTNHRQVGTSRQQSGLVEDVSQVSTRHARGTTGNRRQVDIVGHGLTVSVNLENLETAIEIRSLHCDLTVETPRT